MVGALTKEYELLNPLLYPRVEWLCFTFLRWRECWYAFVMFWLKPYCEFHICIEGLTNSWEYWTYTFAHLAFGNQPSISLGKYRPTECNNTLKSCWWFSEVLYFKVTNWGSNNTQRMNWHLWLYRWLINNCNFQKGFQIKFLEVWRESGSRETFVTQH